MNPVKKNEQFYASVNMDRQDYGKAAGFSAKLLNESDNSVTNVTGPFEEVILSIASPATGTASNSENIGSSRIRVNTGHGITAGMVIQESTNSKMYFVLSVTATQINVKQPLVAAVNSGATITQVGNTALYKVPITIAATGEYAVLISSPDLGIYNFPFAIKVYDQDIDSATAQTVTSQGVVTAAITASQGVITGAISTTETNINNHVDAQLASLSSTLTTALGNLQTHVDASIATAQSAINGNVDLQTAAVSSNVDAKAAEINAKLDVINAGVRFVAFV